MIKEGIELILGIKLSRKSENNFNFSNSKDSASHTLDFFLCVSAEGTAFSKRTFGIDLIEHV